MFFLVGGGLRVVFLLHLGAEEAQRDDEDFVEENIAGDPRRRAERLSGRYERKPKRSSRGRL